MKDVRGKKIFVGLSGGVDSSVTATLLQQAGADVYGVFIKGWYPAGMTCTWSEDRRDAMRVAAHLGIPFHTLDASFAYKKYVIDYLVNEYGAGRTPNPDIMCNREVKFGVFYEFAKKHNADYLATGHYVQYQKSILSRAVDEEKDQSYFLWAVSPASLAMTLFPLGTYTKKKVRELAKAYALPTAEKNDSQGICFLGEISMDDFLRAELEVVSGRAVTFEGKKVGSHEGAVLYTIGERVGLKNAEPGPWFVHAKDMRSNTITVSKLAVKAQKRTSISLGQCNFFTKPLSTQVLTAQYRYHGPRIPGTFADGVFYPSVDLPESIAQGQSLVLYNGNDVVGGGIIV